MPRSVEGFRESPDTAVLLCRKVFDGGPILRVSRDGEGDWQFLCGGVHGDGGCEPKLVCLAEVVRLDPGLSSLGDLCPNWSASRASAADPWVREDEYERLIRDNVREFGWHVALIPGDEEGPGFAYTIGLHQAFGKPEVIVFGIPQEVMHAIVNHAGEEFKAGRSIPLDRPLDGYLEGYPVVFKRVKKAHYKEYFGYGLWFYSGPKFTAIQCCWPDKKGRFPWDKGFEKKWLKAQPLLG
jgi:hypothetical protein